MKLCIALARGQNHFFHELADAVIDELAQIGVDAEKSVGPLPAVDRETAYLLLPPHEYYRLTPTSEHPEAKHLKRTIFLCAEQPGTSFFDDDIKLISATGCPAFDINAASAKLIRHCGLKADHFQLGWTRSWSSLDPTVTGAEEFDNRLIDAIHLGSRSARREVVLAQAARYLAARECHLPIGDNTAPLLAEHEDWIGEDAKWAQLASSKVLLNIHRDERPYFEWLRVVQAICNGTLVVTDFSADVDPLVPGESLIEARGEDLGLIASMMIDDPVRCHEMRCAAYRTIRDEVPLRLAVERLAERAESLLGWWRRGLPAIEPDRFAAEKTGVRRPKAEGWRHLLSNTNADSVLRVESVLGRTLRDQKLAIASLRNDITRLQSELAEKDILPTVERVASTPAWKSKSAHVSVITPLHNYEQHIARTLTSVTHSTLREFELIIVDDGSSDGSLDAARGWLTDNPNVPALLLRHPTNRGLGQARNTAIDCARAPFVFALDADNSIYPNCLERLVELLEDDERAAFAWGYLERHTATHRSIGVLSSFPWSRERFANGNYIDAMVMWRRSALIELGLYTTDPALYGWEDFELFCRLAERGGHGAMTPQFVARYRTSSVSMASTMNLAGVAMTQQLAEMYPATFGSD